VDPLPRAKELADAAEYCQALEYLDYFMDYDYVKENPKVTELYDEIKKKRGSYLFVGTDIVTGIVKGKGACTESLVSATVSDFFLIGDVRDLTIGLTNKYYYGQEADEFTMALAGVGILASGITYMTAGASTPAKASLSIFKVAKKLNKIPASLEKSLIRIFKRSAMTRDLKPMMPVARSVYRISKTPGLRMRDVFAVLSRSRNVRDLKTMERVAATYGKNTGKFLNLGGEVPIRLIRRFPLEKNIAEAVDTAVKYGPEGTKLLAKTGPTRFLKYVRATKYAARTTRSVWQGRLNSLLVKTMSLLPRPAIFSLAMLSGLVVLAVPTGFVLRKVTRKKG
jgi:voltage-gated potassium channel Kch